MKRRNLNGLLLGLAAIALFPAHAWAYYHPRAGRFVQRDPVDHADGMNAYRYVAGNPITASDPSGLWKVYRTHGLRALATAEEGDTIGTLARRVHLDPSEVDRWLVVPNGEIRTTYGLMSVQKIGLYWPSGDVEVCPDETVTVPNLAVIVVGKTWKAGEGPLSWLAAVAADPSFRGWMVRRALEMEDFFRSAGYATRLLGVLNPQEGNRAQILSELRRHSVDMAGFGFAGHGVGGGCSRH